MADNCEKPLVFISYSHKDEIWKDRLRPHLNMFSYDSELVIWDDRQIEPTTAWFDEIKCIMEQAKVAICLISPDYLSSSFCRNHEIPYLLERHAKGDMILLFILVRPCAWDKLPWLAALQILPRDNKAVSSHFGENWDTPFAEIASHVIEQISLRGLTPYMRRCDPDEHDDLVRDWVDLTRLPTSGFDVVGRDQDIQFLNEAFDGTKLNIVSLRAWGGVGKSTLVNKWCEYLAADNYRGAQRVFAWSFYSQGTNERVTSADAFIDEALRFFGDKDPEAGSAWAKGERLAGLVGREKALLLLDGMEPLQDRHQGIKDPALSRLVECLAIENAGLCVITTREPVKELFDFPKTTVEKDLEYLSKEAGRALLRIKGLRAADDLLEEVSEAFGDHALALDLLASFLNLTRRDVRDALDIPDLPDVTVEAGKHPRRVMAAFAEHFGEGPELDLLHVMGLFDRPAARGCIAALREPPAIPGLTDHLVRENGGKLTTWWRRAISRGEVPSSDVIWEKLLAHLRGLGLLAEASHHATDELDAHPLVREHFGTGLRARRDDAWKAGHERLYEHLKGEAEHRPDTLAGMAPLFQAVHHGCQAGRRQETLDEVYQERIVRQDEFFLTKKLGAFGADLGLVASFFDPPFEHPAADLTEPHRAWLLHQAAFRLRALGRLGEAVAPMRAGLDMRVEQENWSEAARSASNLSELQLTLGDVVAAEASGEAAVDHADQTGVAFQRKTRRARLADAKHQFGLCDDALSLFKEAEAIHAEGEPRYSKLYALSGYQYCDLLLSLGQTEAVCERAAYALEIAREQGQLLSIALDNLSLGRAALALGDLDEARTRLGQAVDGLREAGTVHHIPRSLLARAAFFREVKEYAQSRRDMDEAMRIAKRGGMRLHQCDAHLGYARLALAERRPDAAREPLKSAEALVSACDYHRRDPDIDELKEKLGL